MASGDPPDENLGPTLVAITAVLLVFSTLSTAARLWVRYARRALGADDYTIAATLLLGFGRHIAQFISVPYGNGRHKIYLSDQQYQVVNFYNWITQFFLYSMLCLLKTSICLLVLRIKNTPKLRWSLYVLIAGLVVTSLAPMIMLLAQCQPVQASWTGQGTCLPAAGRIYAIWIQVAYSMLTDVICTLLPVVVVWDLKMGLRDKLGICLLMSLGLIATVFAAVRASSLTLQASDTSWEYCFAAMWGNIELHMGIIAANLAPARGIFAYFRSKASGTLHMLSSNRTKSGTHKMTAQGSSGIGGSGRRGYLRSESPMGDEDFVGQGNERFVMRTTCRRGSEGGKSGDSRDRILGRDIKKDVEMHVVENDHGSNSSAGSARGRVM